MTVRKQRQQGDYDFPIFYAIWLTKLGYDLSEILLKIGSFLEDENWNQNTKVLLLWRGVGKSTLTDIWVAYKLSKNPALRFLFLSATKELAKSASQDILHIIDNHPLCEHLRITTTRVERRKDSFFVKGSTDARVPSVRASGITSTITGGRADYIIFDDVESPENSGTEYKRKELRRKISESFNLLTPEIGRKLFIGTYHDTDSIYDDVTFAKKASRLRVPVITNTSGEFPFIKGTSNWPDRFTDEWIIDKQRECSGRAEFYSQYLLIPETIEGSELDPSLIAVYSQEVYFNSIMGRHSAWLGDPTNKKEGAVKIASVSAFWDPAFAQRRQDDSVLSIVFTTDDGHIYIHRVFALDGDPAEQCKQVKRFALEYRLPVINVEDNGQGGTVTSQMLLMALDGTGIGVNGVASRINKQTRIMDAFETPLYAKLIHMSDQVASSEFVNQLKDFRPSQTRQRDDYIDSVAYAIMQQPVRIAANLIGYNGVYHNGWSDMGTVDIKREYFRL